MRYHLGLGIGHTYLPRRTSPSRPAKRLPSQYEHETEPVVEGEQLAAQECEKMYEEALADSSGGSSDGGEVLSARELDESGESSYGESDDEHLLAMEEMYHIWALEA